MRKLLVVINPIAGKGFAPRLLQLVGQSQLHKTYQVEMILTEGSGHALELATKACRDGFDAVVAAGGDGTVNEVASGLIGSNVALGILPAGSGNGFARPLGYAMDPIRAMAQIAFSEKRKIDTLLINGKPGINVSGFGFDGHVAWQFNHAGKRGLSTYTKIAIRELFSFPTIHFRLILDGKAMDQAAHMLVVANSREFGNAAIIAPQADIADGKMDIVLVKRPPIHRVPGLFFRLFKGTLKNNKDVHYHTCSVLHGEMDRPVHYHVDGEAMEPTSQIQIEVKPLSLTILQPKPFLT